MKWIGFFICLVLMLAFGSQLPFSRVSSGQNDFLQFYGGAKLVGTGKLHDLGAMKERQLREAGIYLPAVQYVRPDYYAVLLKPLAALPFRTAYVAFQIVNLAALLGFLWLFRDVVALRWLAPVSIPLLIGFANGQDIPLLLFFFALAVRLESRGWNFAAGAVLALCTIKVHFLIFIPVALILTKRWRVITGGATALAGLTALAAVFEGWDWVLRYPEALRRPEIHPDKIQFLNLRGVLMAAEITSQLWITAITVATALAIVAALWWLRKQSLPLNLAAALTGGLLLSYHLGVHDCALLLLIVALAPEESVLARGCMLLSVPLPYYLLMLDGWVGAIPALTLIAIIGFSTRQFIKNREVFEFRSTSPLGAR